MVTEVDVQSELMCDCDMSTGRQHDSDAATVCLANGSLTQVPATSAASRLTSSSEQPTSSAESESSLPVVETSVSCTVSTVLKPSLVNSIPLLSIRQAVVSRSEDEPFSLLPVVSSSSSVVQVTTPPPSVFSVPCTGRESPDVFTDVYLDDDNVEVRRGAQTLTVRAAGTQSTESSRDGSPSRLQPGASSSKGS